VLFLFIRLLLTKLNMVFVCVSSEVRVLVHNVVKISDFPVERSFVVSRDHVDQVTPSEVSFKANNILNCLFISATEKHLRVVLILNVHFHGRFDNAGDSNEVGSVLSVEEVEHVALIVVFDEVSSRSS